MFYHETPPLFLWISCSPIECQSGGVGFTMQHLNYFCGSAVSPVDCQLGGIVFTFHHLHCFCGSAVSLIDCQLGGVVFIMQHLHFVVDQLFHLLTTNWEAYFLPRKASIVSVDQLLPY
jgi:hypothetical protein